MDFSALPIAALPLPPAAEKRCGEAVPEPASSRKHLPLAQRLTLNPTITAKVNYFDLAQTKRPPFDLRTSLIWLCLCAHDNSVWWEPRTPDHQDGEDAAPLPLALNFAAWMRYIQDWQVANFAVNEEQEIEALALRVWIGAHETVCVPEEDTKKNGTAPLPTGVSSTPTSSAEAMPAGGTTSSSTCPSAPPMPSSTAGSPPTESPASAPLNPPAETLRSTTSSPPPVGEPFWVAEVAGLHPLRYANGQTDEHGGDGVAADINKALPFDTVELVQEWIRTRRNPGAWLARQHQIG